MDGLKDRQGQSARVRGILWGLVFALVAQMGAWRAAAEEGVRVDDFGAAGDGLTWDHAAFRAAVAAAGPGGTIRLTAGKTYQLCAPVELLEGQTLDGAGATIQRCPEDLAYLRTPAPKGARRIVVDAPGKFEVGMWFFLAAGPGRAHSEDGARAITWIRGDTLGFKRPIGISKSSAVVSFATGAMVVRSPMLLQVHHSNITIKNLTIDGNAAAHGATLNWTSGMHIHVRARSEDKQKIYVRNATIDRLRCVDIFGDCIMSGGVRTIRISNSHFERLAGAAIHLSATRAATIEQCRFIETSRQANRSGHAHGAIEFSQSNYGIAIFDNYIGNIHVDGGEGEAIGAISLAENGDVQIRGNTIVDTDVLLRARLLKDRDYEVVGSEDIVVEDNIAIDAGPVELWTDPKRTKEIFTGVFVRRNYMKNSWIEVSLADSVYITDNHMVFDDDFSIPYAAGQFVEAKGLVTLRNVQRGLVARNFMTGNHRGVVLEHTLYEKAPPIELVVEQNVLVDQTWHAIGMGRFNPLYPGREMSNPLAYRRYSVRDNIFASTRLKRSTSFARYLGETWS